MHAIPRFLYVKLPTVHTTVTSSSSATYIHTLYMDLRMGEKGQGKVCLAERDKQAKSGTTFLDFSQGRTEERER